MTKDNHIRTLKELGRPPKSRLRVALDTDNIIWVRSPLFAVEASRIKNARDLLGWVFHISRQNWATPAVIGDFIEVAAEATGINTRLKQ